MLQKHPIDRGTCADDGGRVPFARLVFVLTFALLCSFLATACQELDNRSFSGAGDGGSSRTDAAAQPTCAVPFSLDPTGEIICGDPDSGAPPVVTQTPPIQTADGITKDPCVQTLQQSLKIRQTTCAGCHAPPAAMGAFAFVLDDARLITARSANPQVLDMAGQRQRLVIPGDPDNSRLYQRIVHTAIAAEGQMPPLNTDPTLPQNPRPSVSDVSVLRTWIMTCLAGAGGV